MNSFRVAISYDPAISGNQTDAERIAYQNIKNGISVLLFNTNNLNIPLITAYRPDVLHAINLYASSPYIDWAASSKIPILSTLSGLDINVYLHRRDTRELVVKSIKYSNALSAFFSHPIEVVIKELSVSPNITQLIPRGLPLFMQYKSKSAREIFRTQYGYSNSDYIVLVPARISPEKNNLFPVGPIQKLHRKYPNLRLLFCGHNINKDYYAKFDKAIRGKGYIQYAGNIPMNKSYELFSGVDVVLNCSETELGGNAVFEAMLMKKPIIASNISGNRVLIEDNKTGLLFEPQNINDFSSKLVRCMTDKKIVNDIANEAYKTSWRAINVHEADDYQRIYERLVKLAA